MGLDVGIGSLERCPVEHVVRDVMAKAGLEWPKREPEAADLNFLERAYAIQGFGEFCREENWPFPHARRITCSCWQAIIPVDFPEPLPMFTDKSPQDYPELWIPFSYGFTVEEERIKLEEEYQERLKMPFEKRGRICRIEPSTRYRYYTNTPASEVYLLSAPRLMREIESHLASLDIVLTRGEDGDYSPWLSGDPPRSAECAAYLYCCCDVAIRLDVAIWFSG